MAVACLVVENMAAIVRLEVWWVVEWRVLRRRQGGVSVSMIEVGRGENPKHQRRESACAHWLSPLRLTFCPRRPSASLECQPLSGLQIACGLRNLHSMLAT